MTSETPDTYVTVRRTPKDSLKVLHCPFCGSEHWHGAGSAPGPDYGHRVAHCIPENVPAHLRERYEQGYFLREELERETEGAAKPKAPKQKGQRGSAGPRKVHDAAPSYNKTQPGGKARWQSMRIASARRTSGTRRENTSSR